MYNVPSTSSITSTRYTTYICWSAMSYSHCGLLVSSWSPDCSISHQPSGCSIGISEQPSFAQHCTGTQVLVPLSLCAQHYAVYHSTAQEKFWGPILYYSLIPQKCCDLMKPVILLFSTCMFCTLGHQYLSLPMFKNPCTQN